MNKEQQYPEDQQTEKSTMENTKEQERVHTEQKYIDFFLIICPHRHHTTRWKHRLMTHLILLQGKN